MSSELFVYGTLKDPAVRRKIVGRELTIVPDALAGYRLGTLRAGQNQYPVIDRDESQKVPVPGMCLSLTKRELEACDRYEGQWYLRVEVILLSGLRAYVYVRRSVVSDTSTGHRSD